MSYNSKIQYVSSSWNVIKGCSKISLGCDNCYAEKMAKRIVGMKPQSDYKFVVGKTGWNNTVYFSETQLSEPLKWRTPKIIFICSMSDFFHAKVLHIWQMKVFDIIAKCPQHTFLIFTKRPASAALRAQNSFLENYFKLPNIILVVTMENQDQMNKRMPYLMEVPYVRKAVSLEPLLSDIKFKPEWLKEIDWVIAGCESGTPHRPMNEDWVRSIRDQVVPWMIPFYFKQKYIGRKKISNPLLDNVPWQQYPDFK